MTKTRALFTMFMVWASLLTMPAVAQEMTEPSVVIDAKGEVNYDEKSHLTTATNGVIIKYLTPVKGSNVVLTADKVSWNSDTSDFFAEGGVRLQRFDQTWIGEKLHYNYATREMDGEEFRTGKQPLFASGESLHGEGVGLTTTTNTNGIYVGKYAMATTDDYSKPLLTVRAKEITIVPDRYVEAHNATLYAGNVPIFYFPYYKRDISTNQNNFTFLPGYRSAFGPYMLSSYNWYIGDYLSGSMHADWRERRGFGSGPDVNANLGQFGEAKFKYYYARDNEPGVDPLSNIPNPKDRQRVYFSYDAMPVTNFTIKSQVSYWSDPDVTHDFFESQYQKDVQPKTFIEVNKYWNNWSLDTLAQTRVNPFFDTVERLPDVRLSGFRQEILDTPLYYESQSSLGYYRRLFSDTNLPAPPAEFGGRRADTFHQITLPETFFGWLNFTPRAGGRFTYYSSTAGAGATNSEQERGIFNTGAEVSFKASHVWSDTQNHFWDLDGLRHIISPSLNYVYVPRPNVGPSQLPQYDYEPTNSLELLPIDFPDYNSIDSIDSQNVIRFGLNNRLQTKRQGEIEDFLSWQLYMDWRLRPNTNQTTFSDIYSDFSLKPRKWLTYNSKTRYDIATQRFNLAQNRITFEPNSTWSWTVGHLYLRSGPLFGLGDNLITSMVFYRFNENWGTRIQHYFDAKSGTLQEQDYTIYRDLRSWTAALTFRERDNLTRGRDYTVAFSMSFKAFPRFGLGSDSVSAASLVGY